MALPGTRSAPPGGHTAVLGCLSRPQLMKLKSESFCTMA